MATYKNTELGQVQSSLNCLSQKLKRKVTKATGVKATMKTLQDKALLQELTPSEKVKLSRFEYDFTQLQAEIESIREDCNQLKEVQTQKREEKKKSQTEIFHAENPTSKEDDDAFLANLYGTPNANNNEEREVNFVNM